VLKIRDWLNVILPLGKGEVIVYNLYADESGDDASGRLTVAGYLIGSKALERLTEAWADTLGPLEHFHMKEGHHYKHPEIFEQLLNLISHDHMVVGFDASVMQPEYLDVMNQKLHGQPLKYWFGGPYSFCVGAIADLANKWLNANNPNERDVAYIFEAGYEKQGEADVHLQQINTDPQLTHRKRELRYYSHTFRDGKRKDAGALQAADMLAWHITDGYRNGAFNEAGKRIIDSVPIYAVHYSRKAIEESVRSQLEFCNFYGDLKHAKRISDLSQS
jgi:hypothetical protein